MKQFNLRKIYYHARHQYFTTNNLVVVVGLLIAASWAWGSVEAMERNYQLQKEVDLKQRQLQLSQLETEKLKFEQNYYRSDEYKELAIRERLGLVNPGEKVLILPPNKEPEDDTESTATESAPRRVEESNLQQWINFLFGGNGNRLF